VTDAELIVASRRDPRAFRELYDRWADKLLAYFYRRVLDPEVAADLLAVLAEEPRGRRYAEGCAIYVGAYPAFPNGQTEIVAELWQRGIANSR
jgi:hypothetical protein